MKKLFAIVGLFAALVAESAPTATRAYVDSATNLVYELATSNKQDKIKYVMSLPYGPVKYNGVNIEVTDWEFNYESNCFTHATVQGRYLCDTNGWTYITTDTDPGSGDVIAVNRTFNKYNGNLVVHDTYNDEYYTWYPNSFGLDTPKYDISPIVDFVPIAAHTNRLVTSSGVAHRIDELSASVNERVNSLNVTISQRIYSPDGLSYFTSSGEVYAASFGISNSAWLVTRNSETRKYIYGGKSSSSEFSDYWVEATYGSRLSCFSESYSMSGRFYYRAYWYGANGYFDTNEKYSNLEDCQSQNGFVAYVQGMNTIAGDLLSATRVYVSTNWTKVAQVVWKDDIPTVIVNPLMATNIVNGLLANYPTIDEAKRIPTTKLSDSDELRWIDVYGNVYQVSWPIYWKITCGGLTYGLRTNSVDNGVITWRNGTTEYPQLVYNNGTWTAYNPSGVSIGTLTNKDGTETNLTASSWSAVKGRYCETNIVDHLVYEQNVAGGSVTTNDVKNIVTNDVGGAWTTGRSYYGGDGYALTNTAVRWNDGRWEVYVNGVYNGEQTNGWFVGAVYNPDYWAPYEITNTNPNAVKVTTLKSAFDGTVSEAIYANRSNLPHNALGLAYERNIPSAISNNVPAWALSDTPPESMPDNAVVMTNNTLKTKGGTAITAENVGAFSASGGTLPYLLLSGILSVGEDGIYAGEYPLKFWSDMSISDTNIFKFGYAGGESSLTPDDTPVMTKGMGDTNYFSKAQGESWSTFWDGDDVRVTITNYDSVVNLPDLYIEQRTNEVSQATNLFRTVWREMAHWESFLGTNWNWRSTWSGFKTWAENVVDEIAEKADRAWGYYNSHTGTYSPDGYTVISSSNVMIAANMAYQKTITSSAEVWVLTANEPYEPTGISTNGGFQIRDSDGNIQFEIVKGDKVTVAAQSNAVTVDTTTEPNALVVTYNITAGTHPTAEVCLDLSTANWKAETAADCPATVTWSGTSGAYVARIQPNVATTKCFCKATYQRGGDTYINNRCAVGMSQIVLGGLTYNLGTNTISGKLVLTLTPTN